MAFRLIRNPNKSRESGMIERCWVIGPEHPATWDEANNVYDPVESMNTRWCVILYVPNVDDAEVADMRGLCKPVLPPQWVSGSNYQTGDKTTDFGERWECRIAHQNSSVAPSLDSDNTNPDSQWKPATEEYIQSGRHAGKTDASKLQQSARDDMDDHGYGTVGVANFKSATKRRNSDGTESGV